MNRKTTTKNKTTTKDKKKKRNTLRARAKYIKKIVTSTTIIICTHICESIVCIKFGIGFLSCRVHMCAFVASCCCYAIDHTRVNGTGELLFGCMYASICVCIFSVVYIVIFAACLSRDCLLSEFFPSIFSVAHRSLSEARAQSNNRVKQHTHDFEFFFLFICLLVVHSTFRSFSGTAFFVI